MGLTIKRVRPIAGCWPWNQGNQGNPQPALLHAVSRTKTIIQPIHTSPPEKRIFMDSSSPVKHRVCHSPTPPIPCLLSPPSPPSHSRHSALPGRLSAETQMLPLPPLPALPNCSQKSRAPRYQVPIRHKIHGSSTLQKSILLAFSLYVSSMEPPTLRLFGDPYQLLAVRWRDSVR